MRVLWLLPALFASGAYGQPQTNLSRDGNSWVEVTTGTLPATARLHVSTRGSVILRGVANTAALSYTVRQRVKASSESDARRLLGDVVVRPRAHGEWTSLTLLPVDRNGLDAEVRLNVPRRLAESIVETQGGALDAADLDGAVQLITAGGNIRLDRIGSNAIVKTGGGEIQVGRVAGSLRCVSSAGSIRVDHTGGETWCETAGGEITVHDAGGPLHVSTEGGNVQVDRAAGSVSASSAAGVIDVGKAGGAVHAETKGGSIQVGAAQAVQCESAAGTIRVRSITGSLRVATAAGSILAELLPGTRMEESFLSTGVGDITVFIPSNLSVSVQARNESPGSNGRIISEFPQIQVRRVDLWRLRPAVAEGVLNGGGPVLHLVASNGIIYLKRQK